MGQFLPVFGGICNKLSHEKSRQFSDVTCKKFTHTNSIMWHKNKRKKSGVAIKLLITQNGTVKPNVIAVSGSLIIAAVEKKKTLKQKIHLVSKIPITVLITQTHFFPLGTQYPISSQSKSSHYHFSSRKLSGVWTNAAPFSATCQDIMLLQSGLRSAGPCPQAFTV